MRFLAGLHGAIAAVIICSFLFLDEAGVPLPFAPNEVLLIVAGVLMRTGALPAAIFLPVATAVMFGGMMTGYTWARTVGEGGLEGLARRVNAEGVYIRARDRLRTARPLELAIIRLIPGVRPWATLVAAAAGMNLRRFLVGAVPALLLWEGVLIAFGYLVGLPAERLFGRFERLLVRGVILLGLGVGGYILVHQLRKRGALQSRGFELPVALLLTGAMIASTVAGILAIGRGIAHLRVRGWLDALIVFAVVTVASGISLLRFEIGEARRRRQLDRGAP